MSQYLSFVLLAAAVGACFAVQASANGKFRMNLGSPMWAAFFSISGTFITAISALALLRPILPSSETLRQTQWWNWIGGPLGALIVLGGATLVSELGAALFLALVVAGQLLTSLLLDHFALLGLPEQPMTVGRVLGAALVVAGVVCMKYL
ncbi:MAG TPA: DMT family transporter [Gemmataceae bacterium]